MVLHDTMYLTVICDQVVFGTVVTHGPRSPLAPTAMTRLDIATELFKQAAQHSRRAAKALVCSDRGANLQFSER